MSEQEVGLRTALPVFFCVLLVADVGVEVVNGYLMARYGRRPAERGRVVER